jgi:hypothetical protein
MASAYVFRLLANAFGHAAHQVAVESGTCAQSEPIGRMIQAPALLMALVAVVLLGLGAEPLWMLLGSGSR